MDITRLNRSDEYWKGLDARLGFKASDGKAYLTHVAGVSFENRQEILKRLRDFCSFEHCPPVRLQPEPDNKYDQWAVKVISKFGVRDELTGDYPLEVHIGYLPKRRCPVCARSITGRKATDNVCPDCKTNIALGTPYAAISYFNKYVSTALTSGKVVHCALDNVTEPQHTYGNFGADLWIRIED